MTSRLYREQESRHGLPSIHPRPMSAGYPVYDIKRSNTLDSLDRHVKFSDSYSGRPAFDNNEQNHDQAKFYRDEIARKDRLITQMSRGNGYGHPYDETLIKTSNLTFQSGNNIEHAQIRELEIELNIRDECMRKLQSTLDISRDTEAHHLALIQQLRRELVSSSSQQAMGGSVHRDYSGQLDATNEVGYSTLELTNSQQRIGDLEARLRTHLEERERAEQERTAVERRLQELTSRLTNLFYLEASAASLSSESIMQKAEEMVQENTLLRGKVSTLKQLVGGHEEELRNNRETIVRLSAEAERVQTFVSKSSLEVDNMRVERDCVLARQEEMQREIEILKERLETSQRAWSSMKKELEQLRLTHHPVELEPKWLPCQPDAQRFRENVARLLSDAYVVTDPYEEAIVGRIQNLLVAVREKNSRIEMAEKQISELMQQLSREQDQTRLAERKCKHAEANVLDLEDKLRRQEVTDSSSCVIKNGYNAAQERYVALLDEMAAAMGMPALSADLTIEEATQQVLRFARRLVEGLQSDSQIHHLKEQICSKDRQLEEMRDRLANTEQRNNDKEEEFSRNRKLTKLLDKYKMELNEAHLEIRQLKTKLLEACDANSQAFSKTRKLEGLETKVEQLERLRLRQANQINSMEENLSSVGSLASELKNAQFALDDITRQNKQLLNLRQVISRMLGLDANATSVADLELIARLEKLIIASADQRPSFVLDGVSSHHLADQYRKGYFEQETPRGRTRARSVSPVKKRDPKVY